MIYAATGHRPDKLGGYSDAAHTKLLTLAINFFINNKCDAAISGMALGWDTAWAEAALLNNVPLIAAIPFAGQEKMWPAWSQTKYNNILSKAKETVIVCKGGYASYKMQVRNEYMVDNCDTVVALWNGSPGGTGNCVRYTQQKNKPIINLWDKYETI